MSTQQVTSKSSRSRSVPQEAPSQQTEQLPERDEVYALVSVTYHALQGAETCQQYLRDAEKADDEELAEFFKECGEEQVTRAERAKSLLAARLESDAEDAEDDEETDDDDTEES